MKIHFKFTSLVFSSFSFLRRRQVNHQHIEPRISFPIQVGFFSSLPFGFFPGFFLGFSSDSLFLFHSCPLLSSITFQTGLSDSFWTKDSDLPEINGRLAFWDAQMLANLFWAPVTALSIFTPLYRKLCLETISSKWGCLQSIFSCCEFQYCSFGKYKFLKCCFSAFNNLIKKRLHNSLLTEQKTKTWDRKV